MRRNRILAVVAILVLVVAGVALEIALPSIAASRLANALRANAQGVHVSVSASPGLRLLFGNADTVTVRIDEQRAGQGRLGDLIARTHATDRLDAVVHLLVVRGLTLRDVLLHKEGPNLTAQATVRPADLQAALPPGVSVKPSSDASGFTLRGNIDVLGSYASAALRLAIDAGHIVMQPEGVPFANALRLTVFGDPRVQVTSIGEHSTGGAFVFTAAGRLTGV